MEIHIRRATANDYDDLRGLYDEIDTFPQGNRQRKDHHAK
jgi:hypothetical protein